MGWQQLYDKKNKLYYVNHVETHRAVTYTKPVAHARAHAHGDVGGAGRYGAVRYGQCDTGSALRAVCTPFLILFARPHARPKGVWRITRAAEQTKSKWAPPC